MPGDDDSDPNIHVEETLNFTLADERLLPPNSKEELEKMPDWVVDGGLCVKVTLMIEDERDGT